MSASNNSQNSTSGKDQGHPHEPFVSSTGGMFLLVCIAIVGPALLIVMVEVLYDAIKKRRNKSRESRNKSRESRNKSRESRNKSRESRNKSRESKNKLRESRNKSTESVGDCRQLVDRRETVEDPRRSEASIGTRYEFEKPVENNARLEV